MEKIFRMRQDHYIIIQKKKSKGIYGRATKNEIESLREEGIETQTIPWLNDKDN